MTTTKRLVLLVCAAPACVSCVLLDGQQGRRFPTWSVHAKPASETAIMTAATSGACATVDPWVVKSGAEGVALVIEVKGLSSCQVALLGVELRLRDAAPLRQAITMPAAAMTAGAAFRTYVPLSFDDRAAWNRGSRSATLVVRATVDGQPFESAPWAMGEGEDEP